MTAKRKKTDAHLRTEANNKELQNENEELKRKLVLRSALLRNHMEYTNEINNKMAEFCSELERKTQVLNRMKSDHQSGAILLSKTTFWLIESALA